MESSLFNSVRAGFNTVRYAEIYNERKTTQDQTQQNVGHISIIQYGGQMTISGSGDIYENFKKGGLVGKVAGNAEKPVTFLEEGFDTAPLREMQFDETYYGMHYDCRSSEFSTYP